MTEKTAELLNRLRQIVRAEAETQFAALDRSGRKSEWQTYLDELKSKYSRRPALQTELKKLSEASAA